MNVAAPHLGIGIVPFWFSTFLGIMGVSVIHTTIGGTSLTSFPRCIRSLITPPFVTGGLDEMTSAKDFKLISWKNFLGLSGIVVAVLIPVGIRYWFRGDIASIEETEREADEEELEGLVVESGGPPVASGGKGKGKSNSTPTLGAHLDSQSQSPSGPGAKPPFSRAGTLILLNDNDYELEDDDLKLDFGRAPPPDRRSGAAFGSSGLEAEFDELPPAMPVQSSSETGRR